MAFIRVRTLALVIHQFWMSEWIALLHFYLFSLTFAEEAIIGLGLHGSDIFFTFSILCSTVNSVAFATLFESVLFEVEVKSQYVFLFDSGSVRVNDFTGVVLLD